MVDYFLAIRNIGVYLLLALQACLGNLLGNLLVVVFFYFVFFSTFVLFFLFLVIVERDREVASDSGLSKSCEKVKKVCGSMRKFLSIFSLSQSWISCP